MASKKSEDPILERLITAIRELIKSGELGQALDLIEKSLSPKRNVAIELLILKSQYAVARRHFMQNLIPSEVYLTSMNKISERLMLLMSKIKMKDLISAEIDEDDFFDVDTTHWGSVDYLKQYISDFWATQTCLTIVLNHEKELGKGLKGLREKLGKISNPNYLILNQRIDEFAYLIRRANTSVEPELKNFKKTSARCYYCLYKAIELMYKNKLPKVSELRKTIIQIDRNIHHSKKIRDGFKKLKKSYTEGPKVAEKITVALNDRLKLNNVYIESANRTIKVLEQQKENISFTLKKIFNNWLIYVFYKKPISLLKFFFLKRLHFK